ncbi:hypothetical protein BC826DRAFT_1024091 [Russula brevipes]|nr:hypothetical protein BC826DRAFT_1024091 [Russula brevipes]
MSVLDPWLPTICALLIPFAFRLLPMFRNSSPLSLPAPTPFRTPISALLALYPSPGAPASSDARTMLVRFGQRTSDYALHALPPALLSYTLGGAVLGAVTVRGTGRESRRGIALMLLAYWAYTVHIRIPSRQKHRNGSSDGIIMWHDTLWALRHALFLALPLSIHLLPAPPHTPALSTTLAHLSKTADAQVSHVHLLRLSAAGIQRVPELRARAMAFWARERSIGSAVRRDADRRAGIAPPEGRALLGSPDYAEAQKRAAAAGDAAHDSGGSGNGGEGTLHKAARGAVAALKEAVLRPSQSDGGAQ